MYTRARVNQPFIPQRSFESYIERKKKQHGGKFDASDLNTDFITYFENQKRIEVDFGDETKRGRIGVTTGWKPAFLLMLRRDSIGSSWLITSNCKIIKVVSS